MGGKELWIKEEERVEEVMVDLLYECVSFYAHEIAYEEFEKFHANVPGSGKKMFATNYHML